MSFLEFFSLFESSAPFDARIYKRHVKAGQGLASSIEIKNGQQLRTPVPHDLRQAILHAQLIASIDDPVNVLQHLARYLAMKGDFWAAGKLQETFQAEKQRKDRQRNDRRKGARAINADRKSAKQAWIEAAKRAGRRIRATQVGARCSDSKLAKHIVASREFASLKTRRPSWQTVRGELRTLKLSRVEREKKRGE